MHHLFDKNLFLFQEIFKENNIYNYFWVVSWWFHDILNPLIFLIASKILFVLKSIKIYTLIFYFKIVHAFFYSKIYWVFQIKKNR